MPIARCCGQVMIGTSNTDDNVPPCIQSVIDMSEKSLGLTTTSGGGSLNSQPCRKWFGGMPSEKHEDLHSHPPFGLIFSGACKCIRG